MYQISKNIHGVFEIRKDGIKVAIASARGKAQELVKIMIRRSK